MKSLDGPWAALGRLEALMTMARGRNVPEAMRFNIERMKKHVLEGKLRSNHDAVAKLRLLRAIAAEGPRSDGADIAALDDLVEWADKVIARPSERMSASLGVGF